ncbi:tyrosine-type recombinase/integrase [Nannocystis pusilla]|uniref:Site-specific integrase n=1 Tax=Nannocystis pusilla TaxID=889268 RepID=A0ABS7TJ38_9BACT|nr:site-specific integrase [Nannocystis pusilla]MBZ5708235.1 site-specific integrase [Nannocystis pusilla]
MSEVKEVTAWPYRGTNRWQVSMFLTHPITNLEVRVRKVAPRDRTTMEAAIAWGEHERLKIVTDLCRVPAIPSEAREEGAEKAEGRVPTLAERWLVFRKHRVDNKKHATRLGYELAMKNVMPILGETRLDKIDSVAIGRLREHLRERKHAPSYRNGTVDKVITILRDAMVMGVLKDIPRNLIRETEEETPQINPLSLEECEAVMQQAQTAHDEVMVLLAWHAGLRAGEVAGLQWADITLWDHPAPDSTCGRIDVKRNVCKRVLQDTPKEGEGATPISGRLAAALRRLRAEGHSDLWVLIRPPRPGKKPQFAHESDTSVEQRIALLMQRAGIVNEGGKRPLGPHLFRHSVITHLYVAGATLEEAQHFARHSDPATTRGYYVHLEKERKFHVARRVMSIFEPAPSGVTTPPAGNGAATPDNVVQIRRKRARTA